MNDSEIYQAQQHSPMPSQNNQRSAVPKVFGILHIVFASLGILVSLGSLASTSLFNTFKDMPGFDDSEMAAMTAMMDKIMPYTYADCAVKTVLGIILIFAGIKLLKYKKSGVIFTNFWGITRILWMIVISILSYPVTQEFNQAMAEINPQQGALQEQMGVVSLVLGVVMIAIYPIVSMIFLNRESVKKDLV